jgi:hypothetical protein
MKSIKMTWQSEEKALRISYTLHTKFWLERLDRRDQLVDEGR